MIGNEKRLYIEKFLEQATAYGYMLGVKAMSPSNDRIKKSRIKDWCLINNIPYSAIGRLLKDGKIQEYRTSSAINATIYYSACEIKKQVLYSDLINGLGISTDMCL